MTGAATRANLELPAALDATGASELLARLVAALRGSEIAIDGSKIQQIDAAGVQLLCALVRAAQRRGVALRWTVVSPMLVTCVRLLGVGDLLRLDGVRQEGVEWFE